MTNKQTGDLFSSRKDSNRLVGAYMNLELSDKLTMFCLLNKKKRSEVLESALSAYLASFDSEKMKQDLVKKLVHMFKNGVTEFAKPEAFVTAMLKEIMKKGPTEELHDELKTMISEALLDEGY